MSEKIKTFIVFGVLIGGLILGEILEDYNQFKTAEYKCEQNRLIGWPNKQHKEDCDRWLPVIKKIHERLGI